MSTTRIELERALVEQLHNPEKQDVATGMASDHTVSTLIDPLELLYSSGDANAFDRKFVYLEALGEQSRVTEGGFAGATGTLTLSPSVTDAPTAITGSAANVTTTAITLTDTDETPTANEWIGYTIYAGGQTLDVTSNNNTGTFSGTGGWSGGGAGPGAVAWTLGTRYYISDYSPRLLKRAIKQVLENMYVPHLWAPSLVFDSDFDSNDVTTYWSDVGSPALVQFTTTPIDEQSLFGKRMLFIAGTADTGTYSQQFPVHPNEQLLVSVFGYEDDAAEFQVQLREHSGTDVVDYVTIDNRALTEARFTHTWVSAITAQEDGATIAIVLQTVASGVYICAPIIVQSDRRRAYECPSWLTRESQVLGAYCLPQGVAVENTETYVPFSASLQTRSMPNFLHSPVAITPLQIELEPNISAGPTFLECLRPHAELTTDSATTNADKDVVVSQAEKLIREPERASEYLGIWRAAALVRPRPAPPIGTVGVRIG